MTDILTQFQHCKLVLVSAFGSGCRTVGKEDAFMKAGSRLQTWREVHWVGGGQLQFVSCSLQLLWQVKQSLPSFLKTAQAASLL